MTQIDALVLIAIGGMASWLTASMFQSRQSMLGFPVALMWFFLGGFLYAFGSWPDFWSLFSFAAFFLGIGMALAAYGLRTKKEEVAEGDEYIDEGEETERFIDEGGPDETAVLKMDMAGTARSRSHTARVGELRERAEKRKRVGTRKKKDYGEFN